ncbi:MULTISPECIES: hypothetical protein [unclassified Corynebacterium]|uniref:hypothetical protein n=1 Tax=unclassified Corynebacterium TaxID=2624378 RepID=UPI0034CF943D
MLITIIGIISIVIGFACVGTAYYLYQQKGQRTAPIVLGLLALVFVTLVPAGSAVFFAATQGG